MKDTDIIIEVAKLDGWKVHPIENYYGFTSNMWFEKQGDEGSICHSSKMFHLEELPLYLTSRDAIVPVIEKCAADKKFNDDFPYALYSILPRKTADENSYTSVMAVLATPRQLCEALLRATGKWKD